MRLLVVAALLTTPVRAFADDAPGTSSYRMETLAVDGITLGLGVGSYETRGATSDRLFEAALGGLVLGAPTVHLLHHRWGRGATSLGVRIGLPLLGVALGGFFGGPCLPQYDCDAYVQDQLKGLVVGAVAAMVFDAAFLGGGDDAPAPTISPTVRAANGGVSLGLSGRF
jgi:hypothetical protein